MFSFAFAAMAVYAVWLCGAGSKRFRGYSGNVHSLRVSDEQYLRMAFLDSCDPQNSGNADKHDPSQSLKDIMMSHHADLAQHVVGLAFTRRNKVYKTRLDHLTAEERVVLLVRLVISKVFLGFG